MSLVPGEREPSGSGVKAEPCCTRPLYWVSTPCASGDPQDRGLRCRLGFLRDAHELEDILLCVFYRSLLFYFSIKMQLEHYIDFLFKLCAEIGCIGNEFHFRSIEGFSELGLMRAWLQGVSWPKDLGLDQGSTGGRELAGDTCLHGASCVLGQFCVTLLPSGRLSG